MKSKVISVGLLILIVVVGISLLMQSGGPAPESAERRAVVQLLRPDSQRIVELQRDLTDSSMSEIRSGETTAAVSFDGDLRDLPQIGPEKRPDRPEFEVDNEQYIDLSYVDSLRQDASDAPNIIPGPIQNFDGLDAATWGAGVPPDPVGDVGPNHYIQAVNIAIGIYNKTGSQLAAFTFDTLFDGTGTACDANNRGDPFVLYDIVSGRWIISDFAYSDIDNGPYYQCFAVSKTADPVSGGWWFYGFRADDNDHPWFNDYSKLSVWGDGIYMVATMIDCVDTSGCLSFTLKGVRYWALNRTDMINGDPINFQFVDLGTGFYHSLPSNADLDIPPGGTPNYLIELGSNASIKTLKFSVDWETPANSTLTGPFMTNVSTLAFMGNDIDHPNGSISLDSLSGQLMNQLQYSNVDGIPALWANQTVASGGVAGIRWHEFRNLSGTPTLFQEGTYQPDSNFRWMGSLAVDHEGNMALGYSIASLSLNPGIRYAGRLVSDTLGILGQGEAILLSGPADIQGTPRWGDYSSMTMDPDGCTFWYTSEYMVTTSTVDWGTRIGSFRMPGCVDLPAPTLLLTLDASNSPDLDLQWTALSGCTAYTIYESTSPYQLPPAGSAIDAGANITYTLANKLGSPSANYYYYVVGCGRVQSNHSAEFDFAIQPGLNGR